VSPLWLSSANAETCPACNAKAVLPGIVLDPFCGSGTTLAAAWKAGRRGIGCDLRSGEGGLGTARPRLEAATAQSLLFRE
jgi:hypothetical protein